MCFYMRRCPAMVDGGSNVAIEIGVLGQRNEAVDKLSA